MWSAGEPLSLGWVCVRICACWWAIAVIVLESAHVNGWMGGKNKFDNCTRATNEMNKTKMKRHCFCCCCVVVAVAGVFDGFFFLWWYSTSVSARRTNLKIARANGWQDLFDNAYYWLWLVTTLNQANIECSPTLTIYSHIHMYMCVCIEYSKHRQSVDCPVCKF